MSVTYKLGLTGYPLGHSLSPKIHKNLLETAGLAGKYGLYPAEDENALEELVDRIREGEIHGLNVTIPHKQTIMPLLDKLTKVAETIGAVNTVFVEGGQLIGDNTDAEGFLSDLKNSELWKETGAALVLGAGGAARAGVYALKEAGWIVMAAARRVESALGLGVQAIALEAKAIRPHLDNIDLIVNATPVGMHPNVDTSPWPEGLPFPSKAGVYDMVYNPRETTLTQMAEEAGLKARTGMGMLEAQARLAFERWTGSQGQPAARTK